MRFTIFRHVCPGRFFPLVFAVFFIASAMADETADADKLLQTGQLSEALSKVDNFLMQNPEDAKMRFLRGLILTQQHRRAEAIALFTQLIEDFPQSPEPYNNLAVLYAAAGQYEKARDTLEAAIRIEPEYATARQNLADINARLAKQASDKTPQDQTAPIDVMLPALDWGQPSAPAKIKGGGIEKGTARPAGYKVKRGESLGQIARRLKPDGVSLDQMLLALYRVNSEAFFADNLHLLRAGRILSVPDIEVARNVDAAEAKAIIAAHTADFRQYQYRLANRLADLAAERPAGVPQREAGGRIEFDIEEQLAAANRSVDKLRLLGPDSGGGLGSASADAEELIAMQMALEDAQMHVRQLEKNIDDLQKLLQIKNKIRTQPERQAASRTADTRPVQSMREADSTFTPLAVKATVPENRQPVESGESVSNADSMRIHALWLGLCAVMLMGLTVFVFFSTHTAVPGVRSVKSTPDRRMHHHDRRRYRDRLA